ncbi:hydroxymethylpyrimidine/phosphomethylpyrimidine kinase [Salinibacter ruber]|jgi:hydroxymethylpyrimidine/phosphomethylpyrimidine kinase|uniref:hydroxymethylpyrimidine kinase n=2 Tax=Salinibacter ruber TaxID=146919 RepID=A0A9X2TYN9_9BACT|nr:bifunctional hydroxymethylpyrimidine kinase/phosphomethylpyrimidine kinase [Salinibacter ruber]MCS3629380.1 hydroxymethylpyrimidine/phosphomethylpyrimidine kinase [Salinibacter ruber]MCS3634597.1 hydroxymethylpyrimidine/phosphomethylpyrimidine kinase [Salinibacter ruber]MCS3642085.1 hydroxymethylpyrimidine/phosphomethylpyrimidine kinase [Salinibacter ruber]MCS3643970.1 hydroxymethylpyrimidine/phosphomethylpyrimidine kinase [Salinibacter ruber]MCS3660266.1 hydroxymethylpyrimidine/phosphometh
MSTKPVALTIAGSDSGGGAGIQADLKAMEANGVFGASALAAVTAQNTEEVSRAHDLPPSLVAAQIDAVVGDMDVQAAKTGMLSAPPIIETVADRVATHDLRPFVVDPVMISKTGFKLLQDEAIDTLVNDLLPLATLVTPNVHEAEHLTDVEIDTPDDLRAAGAALLEHGPDAVLVKGGHLSGADDAVDVLVDGETGRRFQAPRIDTEHTHGTGCTYASAIAAHLAKGHDLGAAVDRAKRYVTGAIRHALPLGHGRGPTNHFFHLDPEAALADADTAAASTEPLADSVNTS